MHKKQFHKVSSYRLSLYTKEKLLELKDISGLSYDNLFRIMIEQYLTNEDNNIKTWKEREE